MADTPSGVAGKAFVTASRLINTLHKSPEEPTGYLFVIAHKFKNETAPCPLLIIGDLTTAWLKFARGLKKDNPKGVLFGECFAEVSADAAKIILLNKAGGGKLAALLKDATVKSLLKKAKTTIDWAKNMSDDAAETPDMDKMLDAGTLDDEEDDSVSDYLENEDGTTENGWEKHGMDAIIIKSLLEEYGAAKKSEVKAKAKVELTTLIPKFLEELRQVKGIPPTNLFTFSQNLEVIWARWQQPETPEQEAAKLIKQAFDLFKALKAAQ